MSTVQEPAMKFYIGIWVGMLAIVGVEAAITYLHMSAGTLLFFLICLASVEASLGVLYLMHVKFERPILLWTIAPATLFVVGFLDYIWPDAYRALHMNVGLFK